jgi:hypothetical protein
MVSRLYFVIRTVRFSNKQPFVKSNSRGVSLVSSDLHFTKKSENSYMAGIIFILVSFLSGILIGDIWFQAGA